MQVTASKRKSRESVGGEEQANKGQTDHEDVRPDGSIGGGASWSTQEDSAHSVTHKKKPAAGSPRSGNNAAGRAKVVTAILGMDTVVQADDDELLIGRAKEGQWMQL